MTAMKNPRAQDSIRLHWWIIAAVILHLLFLYMMKPLIRTPPPFEKVFEITAWSRQSSMDTEREEEIDDSEYEPEDDIPKGQVVNAPEVADSRRPDKTRFLAERNNRVKRQTRSRIRIRGVQKATPAPSGPGGPGSEVEPGGRPSETEGQKTADENLAVSPQGRVSRQRGGPDAQLRINLKPSLAALNAAIAGMGLDNLEDVEESDRTFLNTIEWRHATFFNRVKWQVEQYWRPDIEYRRHDPYGNVYGYRDRETVIRVVLHSDGRLFRQYVVRPSGASFLDQEALEAIAKASPFPNPPDALKDSKTGIIAFTFSFMVRIDGPPMFRMRRYDGPLR